MIRPSTPCAATALSVLLIACGPSGESPEGRDATRRMLALDSALRASIPAEFGTEHPYVPKGELLCAESDFATHLRRVDTLTYDTFAITQPGIEVKVQALLAALDAVAACPPTGPIERGVIVHYGLDSTGRLDARLQVVCLKFDRATGQYTHAASDDCLRVNADGSLALEPMGLVAWRAPGGGWYNYKRQVVIRSDHDGGWKPLDDQNEPNSAIHAESGIRDVIAQNGINGGKLALTAIATPQYRALLPDSTYAEIGFHQGMAWVPMEVVLDDSTYSGAPFMRKALDIGRPCPHACVGQPFSFWRSGTPPRAGCR